MAKKMTLEQRAAKYATNYCASDHNGTRWACHTTGFKAGWRARGRADAVTKAERAVVEAALKLVEARRAGFKVGLVDKANEKFTLAVDNLKARSAK